MAIGEIITVVCDGYALKGFQSVEIERSMQNGAMSFSLEASAASWSPQAMALRNGTTIEIYSSPVGAGGLGDLIVTGAIDEYNAEYEEDGRTVSLSGRSKGRDPIDCHPVKHKTGMVQNKTGQSSRDRETFARTITYLSRSPASCGAFVWTPTQPNPLKTHRWTRRTGEAVRLRRDIKDRLRR